MAYEYFKPRLPANHEIIFVANAEACRVRNTTNVTPNLFSAFFLLKGVLRKIARVT